MKKKCRELLKYYKKRVEFEIHN